MTFFKRSRKNSHNPYLGDQAGRREWNDRYENLSRSRRHWQWAYFSMTALTLIQAVFMGRLMLHSSIEPFVVATNQGMPYAVYPTKPVSIKDSRIVNYALNQFIINARSVLQDASAEKIFLNKVYAYSAGKTKPFLRDYFIDHDPFKQAKQNMVSVQVINSLPIGNHTWQITWDETKKDIASGAHVKKTRWLAQLHYEFGPINHRFLVDNPFGIYVTDLAWSQSQTH